MTAPLLLDLDEVSTRAALPGALAFQRRASTLNDEVHGLAGPDAFAVTVHGVRVDLLDLVRYELIRSAGLTLGFVALLQAADVPPGASAEVRLPVPVPEMDLALRTLAATGSPLVAPTRSPSTTVRRPLYVARELARRVRTRPPGDPDVVDVLVAAQLPQHVNDVQAVVRHLEAARGAGVGFVVADERTRDAVEAAGFRIVGGLDSTVLEVQRAARATARVRRRLRAAVEELGDDPEAVAFGASADAALAKQATAALLLGASASRGMERTHATAILTSNPTSLIGRAAARVAQAGGHAVVGLEHGSVFPDDPRWHDLPVDVLCLWGEPSRRAFASSGVPAEVMTVTGAPRFDADRAPTTVRGDVVRDRVLVATSGAGDHVGLDEHLRFIAALARAIEDTPGQGWTIKLHGKDRRDHYAHAAFQRDGVDLLDGDRSRTSIDTHLREATCLVTVSSATTMDALRAGVPVIVLWPAGADAPPEFIARTATRIVHDAEELREAVIAARDGRLAPPDAAYLDEHFAHRGEATERVTAAIVDAISARASRDRGGAH